VDRVEGALGPGDRAIAQAHVDAVRDLREALEHKGVSIDRLRQMLFGSSTETLDRVLPRHRIPRRSLQSAAEAKRKGMDETAPPATPEQSTCISPIRRYARVIHARAASTARSTIPGDPERTFAFEPSRRWKRRCSLTDTALWLLWGGLSTGASQGGGHEEVRRDGPEHHLAPQIWNWDALLPLGDAPEEPGSAATRRTQWEIVAEAAEKCKPVRDELIVERLRAKSSTTTTPP